MKLHVSKGLSLPIEAVTEKIGFLGRTGSGKTYAAQKLAEEMYAADAQFVVLDPVGVWYGLRLDADGKSPGLPVPVFGGLRGDIPLEPGGGALIANLVVDRGISVVIDVSQFESDADKARFAHAFSDRFFFRKKASPSAVHLFIEECQEFVPQNPQREEGRMLHAFTRMWKLGRNFGIGGSLISQRPQEVNKKVLNLTELLFCFQLTGPQERKTLTKWIEEKGIEEDIAAELPKLETGHPHVWSPAWLKVSEVIAIGQKKTFDASSTPKVGRRASARELSPIDLEQLRGEMAATLERAKADDPRELRRQIAALKKDLAAKPKPAPPAPRERKAREIPVLKDAQVKRLETAVVKAEAFAEHLARRAQDICRWSEEVSKAITAHVHGSAPAMHALRPAPSRPTAAPRPAPALRAPAPRRHLEGNVEDGHRPLDRAARALLAVLAQLHPESVTRARLSVLSGYSITSSSFTNALGALRSAGLASGMGDDNRITEAGLATAGSVDPLPRGEELVRYWFGKLGKAERVMLDAITKAYPGALSKEQLSEFSGYSITSSSFTNAIGALRSLRLIDGRAELRASEDLFR